MIICMCRTREDGKPFSLKEAVEFAKQRGGADPSKAREFGEEFTGQKVCCGRCTEAFREAIVAANRGSAPKSSGGTPVVSAHGNSPFSLAEIPVPRG